MNNTLKPGDVVTCINPSGCTSGSLQTYSGNGGALYKVRLAVPGGVGAANKRGPIANPGVIVRRMGDSFNYDTVWDESRFKLFLPGLARRVKIAHDLRTNEESAIRKEFWRKCGERRAV